MGKYRSSFSDALTEEPVAVTANTLTVNAAHAGKTIYADGTGAQTYTIAPDVFAVGDRVRFVRRANQTLTLAAGAGVTLLNPGSALTARARYSRIEIVCTAANTFLVSGDVTV